MGVCQSQPEGDDGDEDDSESERFDRDIASVTSSLDVCLISELGITYGKEELGGSIILNHT